MRLKGDMNVSATQNYNKELDIFEVGFLFTTNNEEIFHVFSMNVFEGRRFELILRILSFLCFQTDDCIDVSEKDLREMNDTDRNKLISNVESFLLNNKKEKMFDYLQIVKYKQYMNKEHLFYNTELLGEIVPGEEFHPFFIESKLLKGYRFHFIYDSVDKTFSNQTIQTVTKQRFEVLNLYEKNFASFENIIEEKHEIVRIRSNEIIDRISEFVNEDKVLRMKFLFL